MNNTRLKSPFLLALAVPMALLLSWPATAAKPNDPAGSSQLTVTTALAGESGETPGLAEGNEVLVYSITLANGSGKERIADVTETVPEGTTYVGGDDFSEACSVGASAGAECTITGVSVPGKGKTTLSFAVRVDDPVTTESIVNLISVTGVDCLDGSGNLCSNLLATSGIGSSSGFERLGQADWNETSVRKVLHAFAYAGLATDAQIAAWAAMNPEVAITEMLTFSYINGQLSPAEDASVVYADSLKNLQDFWSSDTNMANPMRWDKRNSYTTLSDNTARTEKLVSLGNLQRTWLQAVNTRGINPFLHRVGFFLTNYHMSVRANMSSPGLFRSYYDEITGDLVAGKPFTDVIANASKSAAVARRYKHQSNRFVNSRMEFIGNDDFAREYFQLFFRYLGRDEDHAYHEDVNIEHNAELLTGMQIDRDPNAYEVGDAILNNVHRFVAPIDFTDHNDAEGRILRNTFYHYAGCLEIFRTEICGTTAAEKIDALSAVVSQDPEVMETLPRYIVEYFADDRLDGDKIAKISATWARSNDDLLAFIRQYAISTTFHSEQTVKYRSTFDRYLTLYNAFVLDNKESFIGRGIGDSPYNEMRAQGGEIFLPIHDVFGGQTGMEAANNPYVFKNAYDAASTNISTKLARVTLYYDTDETRETKAVWEKDWGAVAPRNAEGQYIVGDVADWLWKRIAGDGGKNFDPIARAQVLAMLARGWDFGYAVTRIDSNISSDPQAIYSSEQLTTDPDLVAIIDGLAAETMLLDSPNLTSTRRYENQYMSRAAQFIAMLPYTFALEGK